MPKAPQDKLAVEFVNAAERTFSAAQSGRHDVMANEHVPNVAGELKHIVIVGKYYPPEFGGVERYTSEVACAVSSKCRVTVVVHSRTHQDSIEKSGNLTIIRCATIKTVKSQPLSPSMFTHLRGLKPDLVHFNAPNFWAAAMLSLMNYDAPLVVTHHADVFGRPILRRIVMPIYHRLIRRAKYIVVNSLKNVKYSRDLPRGAGPFIEIPHGVDQRLYDIGDARRADIVEERRKRFGDSPIIGFVGRFVRYKGLPVLVQSLLHLDGVHVLLIGDGPLRDLIIEQVRAANLTDRVHFLGEVSEAEKLRQLAMMDLLVMPSVDTTEAFGVAQIEAQLMGLPVVASRLPTGITDVTIDNVTGLLVPPRDPVALAHAISRLIGDRALARQLGLAGRKHALEHFTLDTFRMSFRKLFEGAMSPTPVELTEGLPGTSQNLIRRMSN
jgi:glycosyltransferase involved in cell wall biosynthesis